MTMRIRAATRTGKCSAEGRYTLAYGLRLGYWPCLKAPYIQVAFHRWRFELWFGLPSYLPKHQDSAAKGIVIP